MRRLTWAARMWAGMCRSELWDDEAAWSSKGLREGDGDGDGDRVGGRESGWRWGWDGE